MFTTTHLPASHLSALHHWLPAETAWSQDYAPSRLETLAREFAPISLKQMDSVALLNRIDTKFVLTSAQLLETLAALRPAYRLLTIDGQRLNHYRTLYFDTPAFDLYHAHINGQAERYKVRSREYTDTRLSFLEVKHKTRKDRTIKERLSTACPVTELTPEYQSWLGNVFPLPGAALEPKLWNTFTRLTLVSNDYPERVTLDVDLTFYAGGQSLRMEGIAIAELKLAAENRCSPFMAQMRAQKIAPRGFSKYSLGVSLLYAQVKKNAIKPKLLWLEKMIEGACAHV